MYSTSELRGFEKVKCDRWESGIYFCNSDADFDFDPASAHYINFTEAAQARNYACGACTELRNTPIPSIRTSTTSPAVKGPTPAGVPVAITSPG